MSGNTDQSSEIAALSRAVADKPRRLGKGLGALLGENSSGVNFTPTFVYVYFWVGMVLVVVLLGNVWSVLSPWKAAADGTGWVLRRLINDPDPRVRPDAQAIEGVDAECQHVLVVGAGDDAEQLDLLLRGERGERQRRHPHQRQPVFARQQAREPGALLAGRGLPLQRQPGAEPGAGLRPVLRLR